MNGVTILDSYQAFVGKFALMLVFAEIVIITVSVYIGMLVETRLDKSLLGFCVAGLCGLVLTVVAYLFVPRGTYYKVFLDDNVRWSEFAERYHIEEMDGSILTVTERE